MPNTREKLIELLDVAFLESDANYGMPSTNQVADHLIANGVRLEEKQATSDKSKWISVKDRLPDCANTVLAIDRDGIMASAYYVGNWHSGGELDECAVTHWMPLPEPPEGE